MTLFLIPVVEGSLALGQVGLGVDGSMVDVLAEIGQVRKLETLPGL